MRLSVLSSLAIVGLFVGGCAASSADDAVGASADLTASDASAGDGTPVRKACVSSFGSGLSGTSGRLDGTVVAVVSPGTRTCSGDRTHVHLQVLSNGSVYDVAANVDGGYIAEKDVPLPKGAFAEGWHRGASLDYVSDLGLHSTDFRTGSLSDLTQELETALASANHVSVFGTIYNHGGMHLIHRSKSGGSDGAIVTEPLAPQARVFAFHFDSQSF